MYWFALTVFLIFIDQSSKLLATWLDWPIFLNDQFAFSLPIPTPIMYGIYSIVLIGITIYVVRMWHRLSVMQKFAWSFVYAGGISNVFERIAFGHVKDFIPIANGMLNIADFFILFGLVLLLVNNRYDKPSTAKV